MNRLIFASNGLDIRAFDDEGDSTIIIKNMQHELQPSPQPESLFDIIDIQWLRTTPNAEVRFTPNNSQDDIIINANSEGLINLDNVPNGVYQVSVNNSQPQPLLKVTEIDYEVFYILYYNEREYFIQVGEVSSRDNIFRIYTIDPVTNREELYWEFTFKSNYGEPITITYSEDESVSPGLLPEGTYIFIVDDDYNNSWKVVDLISSEYEIQVNIDGYYYNPYRYSITFYTLPGSELRIQGPDGYDKTIPTDDYFYNMTLYTDGVGPPPGKSIASLIRDGTVLDDITLTLEVVPMEAPRMYISNNRFTSYIVVEAPSNTMVELGQGDMVIERKRSRGYPDYVEFHNILPNTEYWARYVYDTGTYTYPSEKAFITTP